jgi:ribosome-binding protein aMBF1 (putative translation factor)
VRRGNKGQPAQTQQDPTQPDPQALRRRRLGQLIRIQRVARGWTRRQLGTAVGLVDSDIRRIEAGSYVPTRAQWERLLAALPALPGAVEKAGIEVELAEDPAPADGSDPSKGGTP